MQNDYDNNLQSYFTNMEQVRAMFKEFVSADKLPKRLMLFHGVGGVGKSSLLRIFRLHCKSGKIPVALVSSDDAKSTLDIMKRWMDDLKADGVKFVVLSKTLEAYRAIQAKMEDQIRKNQNKVADIASKAASKTAETAGGALLGAAIGSVVPGVGTAIGGALGGVVSGMCAEALTDWLRGFLSKPDIDLLLDPASKLSADFLEDIAKAAEKKRMVLLLDTFEQMSALEDWVGETAQKIHPNVLVVIAGRKLPDWNRVWSSWMMNAQVEELKPMTEDIMRQLIHRYYATMRGGEPHPAQVEAIIKFARGLPMVVTSAVQLWVKYGVEDFQSVKAEIVANLVDRLMEGVPSALIPALEAAAVVRWFDQPILRTVINKEDVRDMYNELRRFPFVRTRTEGLALHDSVREMMDENLRVQDSERYMELHERAAMYFEKKLEKVTGEEAERLGLERLYHRVRADEEKGIKLFQEMAEELTRYRLVNRLRALLSDINTYSLTNESSKLWREYYGARLMHLDIHIPAAEKIYKSISENDLAAAKLNAYVLCDLGKLLGSPQRVHEPGGIERVEEVIKRSLIYPQDTKLIGNYINLGRAYARVGKDEQALENYYRALDFLMKQGDNLTAARIWTHIKGVYAYQGDWLKAKDAQSQGLRLIPVGTSKSFSKSSLLLGWAIFWAWAGQYKKSANDILEAKDIEQKIGLGIPEFANSDRDLGYAEGMQERFDDAIEHLEKSTLYAREKYGLWSEARALGFWGLVLLRKGELEKAKGKLLLTLDIQMNQIKAYRETPEVLNGLGQLSEIYFQQSQSLDKAILLQDADIYYNKILDIRSTCRFYFECAALTGLSRVKHAQGDIAAIQSLLAKAEQLAQQYEYNDHLASLWLTQGHLACESGNQDKAVAFYKKAMIYALRYNRFLLDELVSGRLQGTPLRPIITYCLERGDDGKKILSALRDWWQVGVNHAGTPRPDSISPIPEGLLLLDAEKLAREREPGDSSVQRKVVEQIEAVL